MPAAQLSRDDVVARLLTVFRHRGYDGASLQELSKATGLGKSSLYHYFPNGKDDMVRAVLASLDEQLREQVFAPLRAAGAPARRIAVMIRALDAFYARGTAPCVLAQLVLGSTHARFRGPVRAIFAEWVDALAAVLVDAGLARRTATARAQDAVLRIEGALVLAGGVGDTAIFARTLKRLPADLLA